MKPGSTVNLAAVDPGFKDEAENKASAETSTEHAPWFVIPANHKWFRDLAIYNILVETLVSFGMKPPPPTVDIDEIRRKYHYK